MRGRLGGDSRGRGSRSLEVVSLAFADRDDWRHSKSVKVCVNTLHDRCSHLFIHTYIYICVHVCICMHIYRCMYGLSRGSSRSWPF